MEVEEMEVEEMEEMEVEEMERYKGRILESQNPEIL